MRANRVIYSSNEFELHLYGDDNKIVGKITFEDEVIRVVRYKQGSREVQASSGPMKQSEFMSKVLDA